MKTSCRISTFAFALSVVCVMGHLANAANEITYNQTWAEQVFSDTCPVEKLPFFFVYGGQPSGELIAGWKRTIEDRKIDGTSRLRTLTLVDPPRGHLPSLILIVTVRASSRASVGQVSGKPPSNAVATRVT